jgi:hypothetical protein
MVHVFPRSLVVVGRKSRGDRVLNQKLGVKMTGVCMKMAIAASVLVGDVD